MKSFAHIQKTPEHLFFSPVEFWLWLNLPNADWILAWSHSSTRPIDFFHSLLPLVLWLGVCQPERLKLVLWLCNEQLSDLAWIYSHSIFTIIDILVYYYLCVYHSYFNHPVVHKKVVNTFNILATSNKQILVCYSRISSKRFSILAATAYKSSTIIGRLNHMWWCVFLC